MSENQAPPVSEAAAALHREAVVVDLHADTPSLLRWGYDLSRRHTPPLPGGALGFHVDLPRLQEGGVTAQVFGLVTVPLRTTQPLRAALAQIRSLEDAARRIPNLWFGPDAARIRQAKAEGAVVALCGLEGAHALEGRLESLDVLARRGLRLLGLAHFTANEACRPAFGLGGDQEAGLTAFGRQLVERANELGVIVDLAHVGRRAFLEAASLSTAPVVVSHTGLAGLRPLWRNITDEQVRAVADTGGCVGIIYARQFLGGRHLDAVVRHIRHCWQVGGEDCPALGSDFDGLILPVRGLEDVAQLPRLTEALLRSGIPERVVLKILGANAMRVFEAVPPRAFREPTDSADR